MDASTNMLFRSISAIYEGTISGSSFYPLLYFKDTTKKNTFHGFRLKGIIPSRLIANVYEEKKKIVMDLLWLVDDSKIQGNDIVSFTIKSSKINIDCSNNELLKKIEEDATLNACFKDLSLFPETIDTVIVGSKEKFSSSNGTKIKISNVPTELFAFSRLVFDQKKIRSEQYQDIIINNILAIIDLIHRSLELVNSLRPQASDTKTFCIRCGQNLPKGSYYCPICGTKQK